MKRTHLGLIVAACALCLNWSPLQAQRKMVVELKDGQPGWEWNLSDFASLTLGGGSLQMLGSEGQTLKAEALSAIEKITFAASTVGIEQVGVEKGSLTLSHDGQTLRLGGWPAGKVAPLAVYTAAGAQLVSQPAWSGAPVSTAGWAPGVYLLRVNKQTFKFTK